MDSDREVRASYQQELRYREWIGDVSDLISIAQEMKESLERLKQLVEVGEAEWLETLRAQAANTNNVMTASAKEDLERFDKAFEVECKITTRHNETLVGQAEDVLSNVRPSDVISWSLTNSGYYGMNRQRINGAVELHAEPRSFSSISSASLRLNLKGSDKAWVLSTLASLKQRIEIGTDPWWGFLRRPYTSIVIFLILAFSSYLLIAVAADDEWLNENSGGASALTVFVSGAVAFAIHAASEKFLTPMEVLATGKQSQASRRLKVVGIGFTTILAILGAVGLTII